MTGELAKALVKAQSSFPGIGKTREVEVTTKTGGKYRFKYAPLEDVLGAVQKPLADNGLAISQLLSTLPGEPPLPALKTLLLHESGESLESEIPLPASAHATPQELGSVITYLRRYAVISLLGIATEDDDDGNHASGNTVNRSAGEGIESASEPTVPSPAEQMVETARQAQAEEKAARTPTDGGDPANVVITFGQTHNGKRLGEVPKGYWKWLHESFTPRTEEQRRIQEAARVLLGVSELAADDPYADIPFAPMPV